MIVSENTVWPPDDGRRDARNMLRNYWLPIKSLIVASNWSHLYLLIKDARSFDCFQNFLFYYCGNIFVRIFLFFCCRHLTLRICLSILDMPCITYLNMCTNTIFLFILVSSLENGLTPWAQTWCFYNTLNRVRMTEIQ